MSDTKKDVDLDLLDEGDDFEEFPAEGEMSKPGPLVVFDFDQTLLNVNSDVEIQELLPGGKPSAELDKVEKEKGWNEFMRQILITLHNNKVSQKEIESSLHKMPLTPGVAEMLKSLNEIGSEIIIISDANEVFIREPLRHLDLFRFITKVFTNPAKFDESGRLNMTPFEEHNPCKLCRPNLCKGDVLQKYITDRESKFPFVAYIGDGPNDFCPMLRLGDNDLAFPRKGYRIETLIKEKSDEGLKIKANIVPWEKTSTITDTILERQKNES